MSYIAEFGGKYCMWNMVADAPETRLMTENELFEYLRAMNPAIDCEAFYMRMDRVRNDGGCSGLNWTKEDLLNFNRAGPGGSNVKSEDELVALYTKPQGESK